MVRIVLFLYLLGAILTFIICVLYYRIDFASEIIDFLCWDLYTTNPVMALLNSILISLVYPFLLLKGLLMFIFTVLYITLYIPASLLFNLKD